MDVCVYVWSIMMKIGMYIFFIEVVVMLSINLIKCRYSEIIDYWKGHSNI